MGRNKRKLVVLLVDQVHDNPDMLESFLRDNSVSVLRAVSGLDCMRRAREEQPDIIVIDTHMPEVDGFQTLQRLRESQLTSSIPVILLTSQKGDSVSIEKGFDLGAEECLTKPIDAEELLVRIRALVRRKQMSAELEKRKSNFMAMLVHDLRSPLVGVRSVLELLRELEAGTVLNENHITMFKSAEVSLNQMLTLITNFLDLARYSSESIRLYQEPFPLHLLVDRSMGHLEFQFRQKQILLENTVRDNLPEAFVDAEKTQRVLLNLLDNALKFTDRGGVVKIGAELADNNGCSHGREKNGQQYIRVSITDTGMGIDKSEVSLLFKPFHQTSSGETISENGSGLGLFICKLIVEAHGGSISVESSPGNKTTFYFTVPVAQNN